jgi:hypothetical protein
VGIDVVDEHVDPNGLVAEALRVPVLIARVAHIDLAVADPHLGVVDVSGLSLVTKHLLETERLRQERERGVDVLVEQVRGDGLHRLLL